MDRWQELENQVALDRDFRAAVKLAKATGLKGNQVVICANNVNRKIMCIDCLALLNTTDLNTESQERFLTPTELDSRTGIESAHQVERVGGSLLPRKSPWQQSP